MRKLRYILAFIYGILFPGILLGISGFYYKNAFRMLLFFWTLSLTILGIYFLLKVFFTNRKVLRNFFSILSVILFLVFGFMGGKEIDFITQGVTTGLFISIGFTQLLLAIPLRKSSQKITNTS